MTYLEREAKVRRELEEKLEIKLERRMVSLRGSDKLWEADLVSEDSSIVGEIKTAGYKGRKSTIMSRLTEACYFLSHVLEAERRLLILTDKGLYDLFISERQGQMAKADGIEIILHKNEEELT